MLNWVMRDAPNANSHGAFGFFSSDFSFFPSDLSFFPSGLSFFFSGLFVSDIFMSHIFMSGIFMPDVLMSDVFISRRLSSWLRSNESLATKAAPHQLEPGPPGLIAVLNTPLAGWSFVKALQSPLFRLVS